MEYYFTNVNTFHHFSASADKLAQFDELCLMSRLHRCQMNMFPECSIDVFADIWFHLYDRFSKRNSVNKFDCVKTALVCNYCLILFVDEKQKRGESCSCIM